MRKLLAVVLNAAALWCVAGAPAQVVYETVTIRNPGNLGELSGEDINMFGSQYGIGETRECGAVDYVYEIGKYEVTAAQYVAFLNAVAATDTFGLYNTFAMPPGEPNSITIARSGVSGSYTYSVAPDWAGRPVGGIAWSDAARFANWMHNGQPSGIQDGSTTEDGAYTLSGATTNPQLQNVVRNPGATWAIPTEDEWYKAAYHKNNGQSGSYWDYASRSDVLGFGWGIPDNNVVTPDPGNSACFWIGPNDQCIGPPYFRTPVGEFENSASEYGTFDQAGNVWEWTESRPSVAGAVTSKRVMRGGSFYNSETSDMLHSAWRHSEFTAAQLARFGFRLVRPRQDCNGNGVPDKDELAAGTARDVNYNGVLDSCDIAAGVSQDCNTNGLPDEAEVGSVTPTAYQWDDGVRDMDITLDFAVWGGGSLVWLNQFNILPERSTIGGVSLSYGYVPNGLPLTVCLWSDPNGDGSPFDAVLLASAPTSAVNVYSNTINYVDIPDTFIGPVGTSFFIGALVFHPSDDLFPANMDFSGSLSESQALSWVFMSSNTEESIDPANLAASPFGGRPLDFGYPGNWVMRAVPAPAIAPQDANHDGIPDDCTPCGSADFNCDGDVGTDADIEAFFACLAGSCPNLPCSSTADFNGDGDVGTDADIEAFFRVLGGSAC
jgi:formylglycine-generating enzyme